MTTINPLLRPQFDSLPKELQQEILSKDASIHSMADLIRCLEQIAGEESS